MTEVTDALLRDLKRILELFDQFPPYEEQFKSHGRNWIDYRRKTLSVLDEIREKLDARLSTSGTIPPNGTETFSSNGLVGDSANSNLALAGAGADSIYSPDRGTVKGTGISSVVGADEKTTEVAIVRRPTASPVAHTQSATVEEVENDSWCSSWFSGLTPANIVPTGSVPVVGQVNSTGSSLLERSWGFLRSFAASDDEMKLDENTSNKMNTALREDQLRTQMISPWFQKSKELVNLLENVFGCADLSQKSDFWKGIDDLTKLCEKDESTRVNAVEFLSGQGLDQGLAHVHEKTAVRLFQEFCSDERVRGSVQSVRDAFERSPSSLRLAETCARLSRIMEERNRVMEELVPATSRELFHSAGEVFQGVLQAITLAICVCSPLSAGKHAKNEKDDRPHNIDEVVGILTEEMNCLLKEFPELSNESVKKRKLM